MDSASALAAENATPPPSEKAEEEAEADAAELHSPKVGLRWLPRLQSSTYTEASADADDPVRAAAVIKGDQWQRCVSAA